MSKCILCGNELLTGDIHWQSGMCNKCWDEHYAVKGGEYNGWYLSETKLNKLLDKIEIGAKNDN